MDNSFFIGFEDEGERNGEAMRRMSGSVAAAARGGYLDEELMDHG